MSVYENAGLSIVELCKIGKTERAGSVKNQPGQVGRGLNAEGDKPSLRSQNLGVLCA
jgi:hypothetical protein